MGIIDHIMERVLPYVIMVITQILAQIISIPRALVSPVKVATLNLATAVMVLASQVGMVNTVLSYVMEIAGLLVYGLSAQKIPYDVFLGTYNSLIEGIQNTLKPLEGLDYIVLYGIMSTVTLISLALYAQSISTQTDKQAVA